MPVFPKPNLQEVTDDGAITTQSIEVAGEILPEQASAPAAKTDAGKVYTKDVGGVTELFYIDSAGTEYQITPNTGSIGGYTHTQSGASTTWTINHNLGSKYVNITCYDASDNVIIPDSINAVSTTQTVATFATSRTGKAVLSVAAVSTQSNSYLHTQSAANTTWTVTHNLNTSYPIVQVYGSSNEVIIPDSAIATDANTVTLTFNTSLTGKCSIIKV